MTILVTGSSGTVGSQVVTRLAEKGASVRALTRNPDKAKLPAGVQAVKGDMIDVESMQAALRGIDTLFLLNAVSADEVTQAIIALSLAREAGIERIVYFSVFHADQYTDVPHFTGKYTAERMIEQFDLPVTVLRPSYFMQNDAGLKEMLLGHGVYSMPVGSVGISMVDTRDIADVAVNSILRRENAASRLPREVIEIVGPQPLTGIELATIWTEVLGKPISYGGDDLDAFEKQSRTRMPSWAARDMRLMVGRFQRDGMVATDSSVETMTKLLGRAPRAYRDFAAETANSWSKG